MVKEKAKDKIAFGTSSEGATTLSIMTFSTTTLSIPLKNVQLSINATQHNNTLQPVSLAERHMFIIRLSVVMLCVIMLSVVAPFSPLFVNGSHVQS